LYNYYELMAVLYVSVLDIPSQDILPWNSTESKGLQWVKAGLYFTIPIFCVSIVFNKKTWTMCLFG
jgi:hypothetical protein